MTHLSLFIGAILCVSLSVWGRLRGNKLILNKLEKLGLSEELEFKKLPIMKLRRNQFRTLWFGCLFFLIFAIILIVISLSASGGQAAGDPIGAVLYLYFMLSLISMIFGLLSMLDGLLLNMNDLLDDKDLLTILQSKGLSEVINPRQPVTNTKAFLHIYHNLQTVYDLKELYKLEKDLNQQGAASNTTELKKDLDFLIDQQNILVQALFPYIYLSLGYEYSEEEQTAKITLIEERIKNEKDRLSGITENIVEKG